jgi:hypothetical protein
MVHIKNHYTMRWSELTSSDLLESCRKLPVLPDLVVRSPRFDPTPNPLTGVGFSFPLNPRPPSPASCGSGVLRKRRPAEVASCGSGVLRKLGRRGSQVPSPRNVGEGSGVRGGSVKYLPLSAPKQPSVAPLPEFGNQRSQGRGANDECACAFPRIQGKDGKGVRLQAV